MSVPNIQNNKYTPNPLPQPVAPRNALLATLDKSAEKKLVFISAAAGSGKTVSSLLWIKKSNRKAVWIGLDAYDNSTSIFYRMFCAGILSVQPDNSRMIEILQSSAFSSTPVEHTIMLLSEFISDESEYVLALDDFHSITNQEILKSLPFILRRLPHSFVTLILSRGEPGAYLSEYMNERQAAVTGGNELSFNTEEIYELFRMRGKNVTAKEAQEAFTLTDGWAIAVITLAQSNAPAPKHLDLNALVRYVQENLWPDWDEDTKAFMIASAALDEMPVGLCEKITGRAGAGAFLEHLRTQRASLTRIEDDVYLYHHLFLDTLRTLPQYLEMDKKNIWRIAAEYYADKGSVIVASQYACKSENIKTILDVLYGHMVINEIPIYENIYHLKASLFKADFEKLCEECPVLYEPVVYMAFSTGDAPRLEKHMDKLKQNLPVIINEYPKFAEAAVTLMLLDYRTPLAEQIAQFNEFPSAVLQDDEMKRSTYSYQLPFLHRGCRDFYELTDKKMYDQWAEANKRILKNNYEQIIHGTSAGIYLEQNRVSEALTEAQTANIKLTDNTAKEIRFSVYTHLADVYIALGKESELETQIEKIEMFIDEEAEFLRPNFLAFKSRIKLWNGETAAGREWLEHYFVNESAVIELYKLYQHFTTIRAYAVLGELEKAKALAVRVRKMGKDFHRPQDAAEAGVLLAVCLWAEGKKEESQEIMETVLSETQPYSFIRLIADEGAAVLHVLKKILKKIEQANYHDLLDAKYVKSVYMAAYTVSKQRGGITAGLKPKQVKLSKKQRMVLGLLAKGYKREGIMEKTGLSLNTVNTHIKIAYSKLEVNSAADAVVKAQELGIIE